MDRIIKDLTFSNSVCNSLQAREKRENGYGQDILQQEGKGLKKGNLEHVAISNMSISIIVHYFN